MCYDIYLSAEKKMAEHVSPVAMTSHIEIVIGGELCLKSLKSLTVRISCVYIIDDCAHLVGGFA